MGGNCLGRINGKTRRERRYFGKIWYLRCFLVKVDDWDGSYFSVWDLRYIRW